MAYSNKSDQAAASKRHYEANKEKVKAKTAARNARQRVLLRETVMQFKQGKPCMDCGGTFHPAAMEFDHGVSEKLFNVGDATRVAMSVTRLVTEMKKCELVCANCHRVRTFGMHIPNGVIGSATPC